MNPRSLVRFSALTAAGLMAAQQVHGASFSLYGDQSVSSAGLAGAGSANPGDASTIFYNVAGMSFLPEKLTITQGTSYIVPRIKYTDGGSSFVNPVLNTPANLTRLQGSGTGGNGGVPGKVFVGQSVPQLYIAYKATDKLSIGFGANAPFGLETDWDPTSVLRYAATNSRVTVANFGLVASYKITPTLSFGAGLDIQYAQVGLSSAIDYGTINASLANGVVGGIQSGVPASIVAALPASIPLATRQTIAANATGAAAQAAGGAISVSTGGLNPAGRDGFLRFGADSIGFGFNLGLMWEPIPGTRFAANVRSNVKHDFEGDSRYTLVPAYGTVGGAVTTGVTGAVANSLTTQLTPLVGGANAAALGTGIGNAVGASVGGSANTAANGLAARFVSQKVKAGLDLPLSASFAVSQKITPNLTLMADVIWTRWSSVEELLINNVNPSSPALSIAALAPFNYKDVFRYSVGGQYVTGPWTFRLGYAYDNTPVNNRVDRTPRLPDADRHTIAVGMSYQLTKAIRVDLAYDHLFVATGNISTVDPSGIHRNVGSFKTSVDVFSAGLTKTFGTTNAVPRPTYSK